MREGKWRGFQHFAIIRIIVDLAYIIPSLSLYLMFIIVFFSLFTICLVLYCYIWRMCTYVVALHTARHLRGISETIADNSRHLTRGPGYYRENPFSVDDVVTLPLSLMRSSSLNRSLLNDRFLFFPFFCTRLLQALSTWHFYVHPRYFIYR